MVPKRRCKKRGYSSSSEGVSVPLDGLNWPVTIGYPSMIIIPSPPSDPDSHFLAAHARLLLTSYRHWFGKDLLTPSTTLEETAQRLFEAEFAVLSHDSAPDPLFNYANRAGLALFEMDWAQLLVTPSRLSAEPVIQEERERLLAEVSAQGYIANYTGVRISRSGRRFRVENASVWNLIDATRGGYAGQAALLSRWHILAPTVPPCS